MIKIRYCCCGCSLQTGTLIILYSFLTLAALDLGLSIWLGTIKNFINAFRIGVAIVVPIPGLIGAHGKLPMLLLPFMIYTCCYLAAFVIFMVVFAFMKAAVLNQLIQYFFMQVKDTYVSIDNKGTTGDTKNNATEATTTPASTTQAPPPVGDMTAGFVILVEVLMAILFGIFFYVFIVVLNHFNELRGSQLTWRERIRNFIS